MTCANLVNVRDATAAPFHADIGKIRMYREDIIRKLSITGFAWPVLVRLAETGEVVVRMSLLSAIDAM